MSRTYRTQLELVYKAKGRFWTSDEHSAYIDVHAATSWLRYLRGDFNWGMSYRLNNRSRDRKPWNKPTKEFKQMNRRIERAQAKQALNLGKGIPVFRKSDCYDWT